MVVKCRNLTGMAVLVVMAACLMVACQRELHFPDEGTSTGEIVYVQSNQPYNNQNSIIAYRVMSDGTLAPLPGSPFSTNGNGVGNPQQVLGPNDSDSEIKITIDKKFLLAVNSGSNTIAVMQINSDGGLTPVPGSPFSSGGETPVSLDIWDQFVFVVNKCHNPLTGTTTLPRYVTLKLGEDGKLSPVPDGTFTTNGGTSPAQALLSNNNTFLFGADFLGFSLTPAKGTLRSFIVNTNGKLVPAEGTPVSIPGAGGALGLWQHPKANILYVGFPMQAKVGIYEFDTRSAELTFTSTVDAGAAACWIRTNKAGNHLYVLNSGENSISIYNSSNPTAPASIGKLTLKNEGPLYTAMGMQFTTSQCFSFEFSTDEKYLYVVSQHTNPAFDIGNFNFMHVLKVMQDGNLTEPGDPIQLPVDNTVRPRGVAVVRL